jgi:hypothetical protein
MVAAPVMTIKNFLPLEKKPTDFIGKGPIPSQYQVCTAHSFLLMGSFKEVLLHLASTSRDIPLQGWLTSFFATLPCYQALQFSTRLLWS